MEEEQKPVEGEGQREPEAPQPPPKSVAGAEPPPVPGQNWDRPPEGRPWQPAPQNQPSSGFDRIIPAKNPPALIGYYLGVFSLIPCAGLALGPAALVCGVLGLKAVGRTPGLPGKGHAWTAIILGGITALANYGSLVFILVSAATQNH